MDKALNNYRTLGTPVMFSDFTTKLVNAKAQYYKDHKQDSTQISQASSSACNNGQSNSRDNGKPYNPTTGEPNQWKINDTDITISYGSVNKVTCDDFQCLPNIT